MGQHDCCEECGHKAPQGRTARPPASPLWMMVLAAAIAPGARSQSTEDIQHILANHPNCFHKGFQWTPDMKETNQKAYSLRECQEQCREMPECKVFAYFPFTRDCYFGDWRAHMVESPFGAIAGYGVCPEPTTMPPDLCRTEVPNNGFPGITGNTSDLAWPGGRQPWSLECWPKNWTGGYIPCQKVTVLQDMHNNWPGKCIGLTKQSQVYAYTPMDPTTKPLCEQSCMENPLCAMWQTGFYGECWQGVGQDCFVRENFNPLGAQRLQHGEVRKLMDLSGWQVVGLFKSFDNGKHYFPHDGEAAIACKSICYSDIRCQFWQYSPKFGCYVEDPSQGYSPAYPLTLEWAYRSTSFALDCIAGEYIQHYCPDHLTTAYPEEEPEGLASCMQRGIRYDPPDMILQQRSVEMNAMACQARCKGVTGCEHFAYWPDGGCHLQDSNAKEVVAEDFRVIAGPASCDEGFGGPVQPINATAAAETNWLTAEGEEALNGDVPGPNIPPAMIAAQPPEPLFPDPLAATQVVEIKMTIENLYASSLTSDERHQLRSQYLVALSRNLGIPPDNLSADYSGTQTGDIQLVPQTTGTEILAYTPTPLSGDLTQLQVNAESPSLAGDLQQATLTVLGSSHAAINGNLEVRDVSVTLQTVPNEPSQEPDCDFLCMYWPIILGGLLLTLVGGLVVGFLMCKQTPSEGKRRTRGLFLSDTEQASAYEPSEYSDGEDDASIWAAEPSWDNSPIRRSPRSPEPTRDLSMSDMYSRTKGDTIFEA